MNSFSKILSLTWIALAAALTGGCAHAEVLPGIDVLAARNYDLLAGKKVGLITNHTGVSKQGLSDIDLLFEAPSHDLVALFSPEHGIRGSEDTAVESGIDEKTGLPIHSLYGATVRPTPEMLRGIDVLVFDMQDIGTRFYTYIATMAYAMQAAKTQKIPFVVLDRPNPVGGHKVEGAIPTPDFCSGLTCIYPIPTRHGMTIGELAKLFNEHFGIGCDLKVVPVSGWKRSQYYDQTGLNWVPPSPNMKTIEGAILYPGLGVAETTDCSVARGTDRPFEMYGAPYFDSVKIIKNLERRTIPGIRFEATSFIPTAPYHPYKGQLCYGVRAIITDRDQLNSVTAGLHMVQAFHDVHPQRYIAFEGFKVEVGDKYAWGLLNSQHQSPDQVAQRWKTNLDQFMKVRAKYLLYPN